MSRKYGGKYWNIKNLLPYQRNFNFVNSERNLGKTYTTEMFCIERAIYKGEEFVYIVRTQQEKQRGIMFDAFKKVLVNEFSNLEFEEEKGTLYLISNDEFEDEKGEIVTEKSKKPLGHCIALSEATKIKKINRPFVKWLIFDEYIVDEKGSGSYVNGWKEPDLLLNIYHTLDRERDYICCFMLANSISFYNPYHLHPAFRIPKIGKGEIWKSENVLYQWATASQEMKQEKSNCKFLKMIESTEYGKYAVKGEFVNDSVSFVEPRPPFAHFAFSVDYLGKRFGVWIDNNTRIYYIDFKYDPSSLYNFALTQGDHNELTIFAKRKSNPVLNGLVEQYKLGLVRFVNMEIKGFAEEAIRLLL